MWGSDVGSQVGDTCLSLPLPETLSSTDSKPSQLLLWHWTVVATTVVTSLKKAEQLARPGGCAPNLCSDSFVVHNGFRLQWLKPDKKNALLLKMWLPSPYWSQCQNLLLSGAKGWAQWFKKRNTHTKRQRSRLTTLFSWVLNAYCLVLAAQYTEQTWQPPMWFLKNAGVSGKRIPLSPNKKFKNSICEITLGSTWNKMITF